MESSEIKVPVSLVQFEARPLATQENLEKMRDLARNQARAGAKIIVFPELSNTGYIEPLAPGHDYSEDRFKKEYGQLLYEASETIGGDYTSMLEQVAREFDVHIVAGLSTRHPVIAGGMYNSSILIDSSGVKAVYHKIHRWKMEKLYFIAGNEIIVQKTEFGNIGLQICYDIRFPELTRAMMLRGADVVINIWASFRPNSLPAVDSQTFIHRAYTRAIENGVFFLSCNRAGNQGDFTFLGHSCIIAPDGAILSSSTSEEPGIVQAELDLNAVTRYRSNVGLLTDRRPDLYAAEA